jgi:hypothetical protein
MFPVSNISDMLDKEGLEIRIAITPNVLTVLPEMFNECLWLAINIH